MILHTMPYSMNVDEKYLTEPSIKILQTADLNPHIYNYPSLPIHLCAIGESIGFLKAAKKEYITDVKQLDGHPYPFFRHTTVFIIPRIMFALSSALIFLIGLIMLLRYYNLSLLYTLAFIPTLMASKAFIYQSWAYLNVNIIGTFFVVATLFHLIYYRNYSTIITRVIVPSALAAAAIASKYNFALVLTSIVLTTLLYEKKHKLLYSLLVVPISLLFFVTFMPFSILDLSDFLNGIAREIVHYYHLGHSGNSRDPGIPQLLFYLHSIMQQFGLPLFLIGIVGIYHAFKIQRKITVILLSFPIFFLLFMSQQKVNFLRNVISIYAIYAIFITIGISYCFQRISSSILNKKGKMTIRALLLLIFFTYPSIKITENLHLFWKKDSRNTVIDTINSSLPQASMLYIPFNLTMDLNPIKNHVVFHQYTDFKIGNFPLKKGTYILLPYYDETHRSGEEAKRINLRIKTLPVKTIKIFGRNPIRAKDMITVPYGDPTIVLSQLTKDYIPPK